MRSRPTVALFVTALLVGAVASCRSAGPYGHATAYVPTSEEAERTKDARDYDPASIAREPDSWRRTKTSLFGVVTARASGAGGAAALTLSVRRLEGQNLCTNADEDTCRVTVSDKDFGVAHVLVKLRPEDEVADRLGPGSLVRTVGVVGEDVDSVDGAPIVRAMFYRYWPKDQFATRTNTTRK